MTPHRSGSPRRRRRARLYTHESPTFTRAMLGIQDASPEDLRVLARDLIDLLWGEGGATSRADPRRLDFDKEWRGDTIEDVAFALSHRPFYPFPK